MANRRHHAAIVIHLQGDGLKILVVSHAEHGRTAAAVIHRLVITRIDLPRLEGIFQQCHELRIVQMVFLGLVGGLDIAKRNRPAVGTDKIHDIALPGEQVVGHDDFLEMIGRIQAGFSIRMLVGCDDQDLFYIHGVGYSTGIRIGGHAKQKKYTQEETNDYIGDHVLTWTLYKYLLMGSGSQAPIDRRQIRLVNLSGKAERRGRDPRFRTPDT